MPAATSIADLHATLQTAFGWSDEHLHRFVIHGVEYGVSHVGGPFRDDARHVRLAGLGLRVTERFLYQYNFTAGWQHRPACGADPAAEPGRSTRAASAAAGRRHPRTGRTRGHYLELTPALPGVPSAQRLRAAKTITGRRAADADDAPRRRDASVGGDHHEELAPCCAG